LDSVTIGPTQKPTFTSAPLDQTTTSAGVVANVRILQEQPLGFTRLADSPRANVLGATPKFWLKAALNALADRYPIAKANCRHIDRNGRGKIPFA